MSFWGPFRNRFGRLYTALGQKCFCMVWTDWQTINGRDFGKGCCSQYHQHLTCKFCTNSFVPKISKAKMWLEKSFAKQFCTKNVCVKCWWNWHLDSNFLSLALSIRTVFWRHKLPYIKLNYIVFHIYPGPQNSLRFIGYLHFVFLTDEYTEKLLDYFFPIWRLRSGVNFINILLEALTNADSKRAKNYWCFHWIFTPLRSAHAIAGRKHVGEIDPWSFLRLTIHCEYLFTFRGK